MGGTADTESPLFTGPSPEDRRDLVRFASRRLRCRATAEDLVQEACLKLIQVTAPLRSPRAFLFRTVFNLALNHWRDEKRRAELRQEVIASECAGVDGATPERKVLAADELRITAAVFATLPARTREVFMLNRFEGLNQREIAERLDISLTVVEKHMSRAVLRLTQALESGAHGAPP